MSGAPVRIAGFVLAGLVVVAFGIRFAFGRMLNTGGAPVDAIQKTAASKDGTVIAYEQTGGGPVIILVSAALVGREGARPLARQLATAFTVVNYDRRGRGKSTIAEPYAVGREIEDLEALATAAAGPVVLFGSSSGAVLALDAANRLGSKVSKVFLYEPPFIVDDSRPPMPETLLQDVTAALSADRRDEAVSLFFVKGMGIPAVGVGFMHLLMPAWKDMTRIAHTAPFDLMILSGTQSGKPLPTERWNATTAPVMVAVGSKSERFFHSGAKALTGVVSARYLSVAGLDHSAMLMAPEKLAAAIRGFAATGK